MENQMLDYVSVSAIVNVNASGYRARVHSNININIIVNASPWLLLALLCTPGICRRQVPMPLRR
jgi:hypothetical protein